MANRHQRRKRAKVIREAVVLGLLQAERSHAIAKIVRNNLKAPKPERSFAPSSVALCQQGTQRKGVKASDLYDPANARRIERTKR